jgi:hypothetical protein
MPPDNDTARGLTHMSETRSHAGLRGADPSRRVIAGGRKEPGTRPTLALEALLQGEGEALTRKAVELAFAGDTVALCLCLDRLMPARKDRHVVFALPKLQTAADACRQPPRLPRQSRPENSRPARQLNCRSSST